MLRTNQVTGEFMSDLTAALRSHLAPRITRHGVLMEVYGEGVLLMGESGVGKSETAIDLIKHGHRLIADDAVDITKMSPDTLVGSSPELIRYYVEMRGIGVIDVRHMFGISAVKESQTIDMIVNLELWRDNCAYDRLGLEEHYTTLLDVQVPRDHPGQAGAEPGHHHRGGGYEQPSEEDGLQRGEGVYGAVGRALWIGGGVSTWDGGSA